MSEFPQANVTPCLGDRGLFSRLRVAAYLNHAAISPASDPVRLAAAQALDALCERGSAAFGQRLAERELLRQNLANLLGAERDEIALVPSTMYGLCALAWSLPWQRGDRVIVFAGEYPTNVSVWQRCSERFGLELVLLPVKDFARPEGADLGPLRAALARGRVRLCAVSAVQFQTGLQMPLQQMAALCHEHAAELAVDGVQALGCVPLDVCAQGVDYLVAGAHKWLMGIDGAGVLYARRELAARFQPAIVGAMSHVNAVDMFTQAGQLDYARPLRDDARVFEGGMLSSVSCSALCASSTTLLQLGPAAIFEHVSAYLDRLEPELVARGFRSLRAADRARRSGILGLLPPDSISPAALAARLVERGVICSSPDGVLRFAPHFPNALDEIPLVLRHLDAAMRG